MHNRTRPTTRISLSSIVGDPNIPADARLIRLYLQLERGEIQCALTRLPLNEITAGFYERRANETVLVSNPSVAEYASSIAHMIRSGARPILDVYWSPLAPNGGNYVCPDHEVHLAAYSNLRFQFLPCRILRPKKITALEAAVWLDKSGEHIRLAKAIRPTVNSYASLVGNDLPSFGELVQRLDAACQSTRDAIVSFHQGDNEELHYHQMLYAVVRRHQRALDSTYRLVQLDRIEHANALTRMAYEAFLNFYVDWLSPEFFGPRLQLLSAIRRGRRTNQKSFKALEVLQNFTNFFETVSEKARISPLGSYFHEAVYPSLSLVAHQSYVHLELEASSFLDSEPAKSSDQVLNIGRWFDVLTAAVLSRVQNDLGMATRNSAA